MSILLVVHAVSCHVWVKILKGFWRKFCHFIQFNLTSTLCCVMSCVGQNSQRFLKKVLSLHQVQSNINLLWMCQVHLDLILHAGLERAKLLLIRTYDQKKVIIFICSIHYHDCNMYLTSYLWEVASVIYTSDKIRTTWCLQTALL